MMFTLEQKHCVHGNTNTSLESELQSVNKHSTVLCGSTHVQCQVHTTCSAQSCTEGVWHSIGRAWEKQQGLRKHLISKQLFVTLYLESFWFCHIFKLSFNYTTLKRITARSWSRWRTFNSGTSGLSTLWGKQ